MNLVLSARDLADDENRRAAIHELERAQDRPGDAIKADWFNRWGGALRAYLQEDDLRNACVLDAAEAKALDAALTTLRTSILEGSPGETLLAALAAIGKLVNDIPRETGA